MNENKNSESNSQKSLKSFFIKLISVSIASIIVINFIFNIFFAERLEKIDRFFMIGRSDVRNDMQGKIRKELNRKNLKCVTEIMGRRYAPTCRARSWYLRTVD